MSKNLHNTIYTNSRLRERTTWPFCKEQGNANPKKQKQVPLPGGSLFNTRVCPSFGQKVVFCPSFGNCPF